MKELQSVSDLLNATLFEAGESFRLDRKRDVQPLAQTYSDKCSVLEFGIKKAIEQLKRTQNDKARTDREV